MAVIKGVDVSYAQGSINWTTMAANADFVIIKSSGGDGGLYTDSFFSSNQTGARAQGMNRGYYHFGSNGEVNAVTEANYFVGVVNSGGNPLQTGELVVLDCETTGTGYSPDPSWAKTWLDTVAGSLGYKPLIYMNLATVNAYNWSAVAGAGYNLWLADWALAYNDFSQTVGAWSSAGLGYPMLQYADNGTGSTYGASSTFIDLDSFGSSNSFASYGKPGGGGGGGTNTATVSTTSSYQQAAPLSYISSSLHDRIIYSNTIQTTVSGTPGNYINFYTLDTGLGQVAYPVGIYSYDGGVTWNDFNFIIGTYGNQPALALQPNVDNSGNFKLSAFVTTNLGGTVNITVRFALLSTFETTSIPTANTNLTQKLGYANVSQQFNYGMYRRIAIDDHTYTNGGTTTVPHGLGVVPNISVWAEPFGGPVTIDPIGWGSTGPVGDLCYAMDSTNIYYHVGIGTYDDSFYRVYKDN